jgi:hypothetical protein
VAVSLLSILNTGREGKPGFNRFARDKAIDRP